MTRRPGKAPTQRQLRVGEELRHSLAWIFERTDFRDPKLANLAVTVTEVRVSPDLKNATAFITPLGGGDATETVAALNRAKAFLRGEMARSVNLRHAPRISFQPDETFDQAGHIGDLLNLPEVQRDLKSVDEEEGAAQEAGEEPDGA
jgi:ribosome-binding factor A